jgi:raffinose/stachyose/melibiose transport system permease protein
VVAMEIFKKDIESKITIFAFLAIPVTLLILFTYVPAVKLLELSFTDWNGIRKTYDYIGMQNYIEIFKEKSVFETLINNLAYVIISFLQTILGLYFAIILDSNIRAKRFFRSAIFMPFILNGIAIAYMFRYMYNYSDGPINLILNAVGLGDHAVRFIGNFWASNLSLAYMGLWQYTGLAMVIFLGALQSVPKDLYESAAIDGSNFFQNIIHITMPSIKLVVSINLFLSLNGALQAFYQPFIMTQGGPGDRTQTFASNAYYTAFKFQDFGKASALGIVLLLLVVIILAVQNFVLRKGGDPD